MSKKTIFGEQDDIPKDGDDGVAEEAAHSWRRLSRRHGVNQRENAWQSRQQPKQSDRGRHGRHRKERRRYRGNSSLRSDRSDTGEPSATEIIEDDDLMLKDLHIVVN